jgi:hypothetical protein
MASATPQVPADHAFYAKMFDLLIKYDDWRGVIAARDIGPEGNIEFSPELAEKIKTYLEDAEERSYHQGGVSCLAMSRSRVLRWCRGIGSQSPACVIQPLTHYIASYSSATHTLPRIAELVRVSDPRLAPFGMIQRSASASTYVPGAVQTLCVTIHSTL